MNVGGRVAVGGMIMMPRVVTVTIAVRVTVFEPQCAVSVYVVFFVGDTLIEPGVATPPMP